MGLHGEFKRIFDLNLSSILAAGMILITITLFIKYLEEVYINTFYDTEDDYHKCKKILLKFFIVLIITIAFLIVIYTYWSRQ